MGCSHEFVTMIGICIQRSAERWITDVSLMKRFPVARKQKQKEKEEKQSDYNY